MIERAARIIAALGGAVESDTETAGVVEALRASKVEPRAIAEAIIRALENEPVLANRRTLWGPATAAGACFAAIGGALGLRAIAIALVPEATFAWILPLLAVIPASFALVSAVLEQKTKRADERERIAVELGLALRKAGVSPRLAIEVGVVISSLDYDRARSLMTHDSDRAIAPALAVRSSGLALEELRQRPTRTLAPAAAAVWAIACFWILYFGTVALSMSKDFGE